MMNKKTLLKAFLVGIAAMLTGCAVLTVDVDVYKGPLANHKDVQTEQMAAMAIGAKPLLVLLRDTLEANYMRFLERDTRFWEGSPLDEQSKKYVEWGKMKLERRLTELYGLPWYKAKFVPPEPVGYRQMRSRFLDSNADYVNNVLSLYEDMNPTENVELSNVYVELRDKINATIDRYSEDYEIFRPTDRKEDQDLAKRVEDKLPKPAKKVKDELPEQAKKREEEEEAKALGKAYREFLHEEERDARRIMKATFIYLEKDPSCLPGALSDLKSTPARDRGPLEIVNSAAYRHLVETNLVNDCADKVFGLKEGELRDEFVGRVKQIARAYLESRATLERLWLVTMDGLVELDDQRIPDDEVSQARADFIAELAKISLEIMQPRYLAVLLDAAKKKSTSKDIDHLAGSLETYPAADPNVPHSRWNYTRMKQFLEERLVKEPAETAKLLRAIHKFCKSDLDPNETPIKRDVGEGDLDSLAYKEGWKFGLIRAPDKRQGPADEPQRRRIFGIIPWGDAVTGAEVARSGWKALPDERTRSRIGSVAFGGGGFAHGRLNDGLETLIENYLEQAAQRDPNKAPQLRRARRLLSDALVRFAQKLLFVANNKSLVSSTGKDSGLVPGATRTISRGLVGDQITDKLADLLQVAQPIRRATEQHERILQAVGNSIVVQADALHQHETHKRKLTERLNTEIHVVNHTLHQSPSHVIDRLLEALIAKRATRENDLNEAQRRKSGADADVSQAGKGLKAAEENIGHLRPGKDETYLTAMQTEHKNVMEAYSLLVDCSSTEDLILKRARELADEVTKAAKLKNSTAPELAAELKDAFTAKANGPTVPPPVKKYLSSTAAYFERFKSGSDEDPLVRVEATNPEDTNVEDTNPEDANAVATNPQDTNVEDIDPEDANAVATNPEDTNVEDIDPEDANAVATNLEDTNVEDAKAEDAYDEIVSILKGEHKNAKLFMKLAEKATAVKEELDRAKRRSQSAEKLIAEATADIAELQDAIGAIAEVGDIVSKKAGDADPDLPPKPIHELLQLTLEKNLCTEKAKPKPNARKCKKLNNAIVVLRDQPPPIEPIVIDRSKLPPESTAKDVRDLWITLLEYEHDLALRNGDEARAKEVMEAIKAARRKREDMIFIRPAMAYLRTSFPATSLQNNPNLTWDNMLGGHAMRSVPFSPQIGEFLNPDAKRDARITAEIDKQFWQNINRVRVAGGGRTNYAVVKDDIGNWYVKGYSADPKDIIQSAQNLALFAAGARAGTSMLPRPDSGQSEKTDEGNAQRTGIENVFAKYREDYALQTLDDYTRLKDILESSKLEGHIREVWKRNENIAPKDGPDDIKALKKMDREMDDAALLHLKEVRERLGGKPKGTAEQIARIFDGLSSLARFQGDLVARIKKLDLPADADKAKKEKDKDEQKERAKRAEGAAVSAVTSAVHARIDEMLDRRRDTVGDYQTALLVIGQAGGKQE